MVVSHQTLVPPVSGPPNFATPVATPPEFPAFSDCTKFILRTPN